VISTHLTVSIVTGEGDLKSGIDGWVYTGVFDLRLCSLLLEREEIGRGSGAL
jgi:hypothetical protein